MCPRYPDPYSGLPSAFFMCGSTEGYDALTSLGYQMTAVQPQNLGQQAGRVRTPLGDLTLEAEPPLYALDFSEVGPIASLAGRLIRAVTATGFH